MKGGIPELRIYIGDVLLHKEVASLEALYDRAEQLREAQPNEG
jgi:aminoglycoside/choline kinase family phosphotransferase